MAGNTITSNKLLEEPSQGDLNWYQPLNLNFSILDQAFGSSYAISLTGSNLSGTPLNLPTPSDTSLSAPLATTYWWMAQQWTISTTGPLTANASIVMPAPTSPATFGGAWIVANNTTTAYQGSYSITITIGSATGITIAAGTVAYIYTDGTNVYLASNVGGGAAGSGGDAIFYLNGQTVNNSYTIPTGDNAGTFGPVTIASGATVTVPASSTWTVV